MTEGLVLGKFMPLHKGHLALIQFGLHNCDLLHILICATDKEPVSGEIRYCWLKEIFQHNSKVNLVYYKYDETILPDTSVSSLAASEKWAQVIKKKFPSLKKIFSSEKYGDFLASFLNIRHESFDEERNAFNVSSSQIRNDPFSYFDYIPQNIQPYFVKKIALVGSESTGKSTLAKKLASHYNTSYVPEVARDIMEHTKDCTYEHLQIIAELHAKAIWQKQKEANKILISDTELFITKSYSQFLFKKELEAEKWISDANKFDLYIFLENDCPYVQDGTRLDKKERDRLSEQHKNFFQKNNIALVPVGGDWENRFERCIEIIDEKFLNNDQENCRHRS